MRQVVRRRPPQRAPNVKTIFRKLAGGLDLVTQPSLVDPGKCFDANNVEPDTIFGGYARIRGFERFDGRTEPTDNSDYWTMTVTVTGTLAIGNTVVGVSSGATGKVLQLSPLVLGRVTGIFIVGETLNVLSTPQAIVTGEAEQQGAETIADDATYCKLAADDWRADIAVVPGSGPIRGVHLFDDVLYAWRDNAGATACVLHKQSTSGWTAVTMFYQVAFTAGGASAPAEGVILTQGGVTATLKRVAKQSGSWAANSAAGVLVISTPSGGSFAAGAATLTGGINVTLSGAHSAIAFPAGGRYECVNANFTGSTATERVYGVNGVGKAFEFDGTIVTPITTGMAVDTPEHVAVHRHQLFLSFKGSVQNSGVGDPFAYSVVLGAEEITTGIAVTAMVSQPGNATGSAMAIFTERQLFTLYGETPSNFNLVPGIPGAGAAPYSAQWFGQALVMSHGGIQRISQSQEYGDFQAAMASAQIQPLINRHANRTVASAVYRERNQYRVFFDDGTAIAMGMDNRKVVGFTPIAYERNITCYCVGRRSDGAEYCYFGDDDGYVYRDNIGTSFDGDAYASWVRLAFDHQGLPRILKQYYSVAVDLRVESGGSIAIGYELGGGTLESDSGDQQTIVQNITLSKTLDVIGAGGYWDQFTWDSFIWDAAAAPTYTFDIDGSETSLSLLFYVNSAVDGTHSVQGMHINYVPLRLKQ